MRVGGGAEQPMKAGTLHRIEREWSGETTLAVRFPMRAKVGVRYNDAVAIERGPLVYALKIGEEWTRVNADKPHRELPHGDFEVRPTTPWNYGLVAGPERARGSPCASRSGRSASSRSRRRAPAWSRGRRDGGSPAWKLARGWAAEVSPADVAWAHEHGRLPGPVEEVTLIPYGCTNIRITEFPRVDPGTEGA